MEVGGDLNVLASITENKLMPGGVRTRYFRLQFLQVFLDLNGTAI
jgi:hypothetical protein